MQALFFAAGFFLLRDPFRSRHTINAAITALAAIPASVAVSAPASVYLVLVTLAARK